MKRYFYPATRAHHAYCMAIDFGMKFERRFGQLWTAEGLLHLTGVREYKIVVAEESLHLLEPQVGDICVTYIGGGMMALEWFDGAERESVETIIQRTGKPFHWPDREETC